MQSYWMQMSGDTSTLDLRDVSPPLPGPGQVQLRMCAASLNRGEFIPGGLHKAGAAKPVGMEGAGEVTLLGEGIARLKVGDRVMGRCVGAFSEFAVMAQREAIEVPQGLSWEEAASIPMTFLVVYDMLVMQGRLQAGEWVLINGVSSGVGVAALQMAKALGARVIGTSGSPDKLERLKPLGLDVGLCTRGADFHDAVMQATEGKGVDLVINTVGGTVFAENIRCMAFQGRLATVGYVDNTFTAEIDLGALHVRRLTLFGVSNKQCTPEQRAMTIPGFTRDIVPMIAAGKLRPVVDRVFPFAELPAAKASMQANQHLGKIVLSMHS
jgi:NADPH2:quinone reductase